MVKVKKKKGESITKLITRFKRKVLDEDIIDNAKEASVYEKPAERRKRKKYRLERLFGRRRDRE